MLAMCPLSDKKQLRHVCFCGEKDSKTEDEMLFDLVCEELDNNDLPILYENEKYISMRQLT
jgi:hypothetical protein